VPASITTRRTAGATLAASMLCACTATTVDPGRSFSLPDISFDADYFYCHVEPELIFAKKCGPGDPAKGDASNGCHFNSSAVSAMVLFDHPAVDCGGGDHPLNAMDVGSGSAPQSNLESVSFEMNKVYTTAPVYVRPSGLGGALYHPRQIFQPDDPQVTTLLSTWASQ
jgi:hypothetical protein